MECHGLAAGLVETKVPGWFTVDGGGGLSLGRAAAPPAWAGSPPLCEKTPTRKAGHRGACRKCLARQRFPRASRGPQIARKSFARGDDGNSQGEK
jgi:hypothetical protein